MDKVISLYGSTVALGHDSVPEIVEMLEELLEEAKRGEVIGLAACWIDPTMAVRERCRIGVARESTMVAACHGMAHRVTANWNNTSELTE